MKYYQHTVVFNEIPDEVTLVFEITNCPYHCTGCHSQHLWQDIGELLSKERFLEIYNKYAGLITNIAFFGGDHHENELVELLELCQKLNVKTTLWTGADCVNKNISSRLTYLKTGRYDPQCGGLDRPTTNQKLVNLMTGESISLLRRKIEI